jgi:cytochrome c biogenesis protein
VLATAGVIGAILRQIPTFALHDPQAYAQQLAAIHAVYDPLSVLGVNVGPVMVDVFDWLGFFRVFSAPWFIFLLTLLAVSIVVCTLDRTPGLWRAARHVKVVQGPSFYDLKLNHRARFSGVGEDALDSLTAVLRPKRFRLKREEAAGAVHLYGDKYRFLKLATLLTHLGLILFLAGAALTTLLGFETVVFLGQGDTAPVQPVGTPNNLVVKNIDFEAPTRPDGSFADFTTDLAVYQNGQQVARKVIRVNDPLYFDGYAFHQNTFGPAEIMTVHDPSGALVWQGPVLLAGQLDGLPQGFLTIPGSDIGLLVVLDKTDSGAPVLALTGLTATPQNGSTNIMFINGLSLGDTSNPTDTGGYSITWQQTSAYTGMVIKRDPGQGMIWVAYLSLISGLILSFYFPRRRVWARLVDGSLELALVADRYANPEREFEQLLDDLATRLRNRPERRLQPSPDTGRA